MRYFKFVCVFIFILCFFCACNDGNDYFSKGTLKSEFLNEKYSKHFFNYESIKNKKDKQDKNYNIYPEISENDFFSEQIEKNPIDKSYEEESKMLEDISPDFQKKYVDIWVDELNFSVEALSERLSETDRKELISLQEKWKAETEDMLHFEKSILTNESYGMKPYSLLNFLFLSARREAYRDRTIRIKYWIYCFDIADSNYYRPVVKFLYSDI